jgi:hypothetical protein
MGRHNFHGAIETIGDSCQADYLVMVACEQCRAEKQMHPYRLISANQTLTSAALGVPLPGFFCKHCRRSARAIVTCTYRRSGEM